MEFFVEQVVLNLGVKILFATGRGLSNSESPPALQQTLQDHLTSVENTCSAETLLQDPVLAGFRTLHERVGKTGKKWASSPENMMAMVLGGRRLPSLSRIVDSYNSVSLHTRLALGAHDLAHVSGAVSLRLTKGDEGYWPIGAKEADRVTPGEYAYCDGNNDILCRLEIRQVEKTKVTLSSRDVFYIIQGHAGVSDAALHQCFDELKAITENYCGGSVDKAEYTLI
jgi:DNA/RNA-binding domain of Phe-tRNA-synthetase-like protein